MRSEFSIDFPALQRLMDRAADSYAKNDLVPAEIATRLMSRLEYIRLSPDAILDLGCRTGRTLEQLAKKYPRAQLVGAELSLGMLKRARGGWFSRRRRHIHPFCGSPVQIGLNAACMDLVISNLTLAWTDAPDQAFAEIKRILKPGALLLFATLGPDTLKELRAALPANSAMHRMHQFFDMHDIGDALVRAGFCDVVMDAEILELRYSSLRAMHREFKALAATNVSQMRPRGISGRRFADSVECRLLDAGDGLRVSLELIYGHAWLPMQSKRAGLADPLSIAPIQLGR